MAAQVVIAGAGPTGLVLALWLSRLGIGVRIVDKSAGAGHDVARPRRAGAHAGVYRQVGLADPSSTRARSGRDQRLGKGAKRGHAAVGGWARTEPVPLPLIFPQDEHERRSSPYWKTRAYGSSAAPSCWRRERRPDGAARGCGTPTAPRRPARPPGSPDATARHSTVRDACASVFPAGPTRTSSTSPTSRQRDRR